MASVSASVLTDRVTSLFAERGLEPDAAAVVARVLVDSDQAGVPSHGVMMVPMYLDRMRAGSVSAAATCPVVSDRGSAVVIDAQNCLGPVSSGAAVAIATQRADEHGFAGVAVRNAFHFGRAGYWAEMIADDRRVGFAFSNTRPLMAAPGGAERVVGNNPLAIAAPSESHGPIVLDMATSVTAMGKIRLAEQRGEPIPPGWALDADGHPTTDPKAAISGMLEAVGGAKGFGVAVMVDILSGALAGGGIGGEVQPLFGDLSVPYNCSHYFMAIDIGRFVDPAEFRRHVDVFSRSIVRSRRRPGVEGLYLPGARTHQNRNANRLECPLASQTLAALNERLAMIGQPAIATISATHGETQ